MANTVSYTFSEFLRTLHHEWAPLQALCPTTVNWTQSPWQSAGWCISSWKHWIVFPFPLSNNWDFTVPLVNGPPAKIIENCNKRTYPKRRFCPESNCWRRELYLKNYASFVLFCSRLLYWASFSSCVRAVHLDWQRLPAAKQSISKWNMINERWLLSLQTKESE